MANPKSATSSDNGFSVIVPTILTNTPQLRADIQRAAQSLGPDVVRINFEPGFDWMGFASIFFHIVLTDHASRPARLREVAQRVELYLMNALGTDENGVHAYFNFRSQSEVARMKDPAWA